MKAEAVGETSTQIQALGKGNQQVLRARLDDK